MLLGLVHGCGGQPECGRTGRIPHHARHRRRPGRFRCSGRNLSDECSRARHLPPVEPDDGGPLVRGPPSCEVRVA
ncbi:hypothetical protein CZ771_09210 [Actinomycetales bacterium JB111]|nr:hypothetical protein CZ771_09210 [Actinomycetales bacterium JB111]